MVYRFSEILGDEVYKNRVIFLLGEHSFFNNIVIDRVRDIAIPREEVNAEQVLDLMSEFGVTSDKEVSRGNSVGFDEFLDSTSSYPMRGFWYCSVEYSELTDKQRERLSVYMKSPQETGYLVITVKDFRKHREILRNNLVARGSSVCAVRLSFPDRASLTEIVKGKLSDGGVKVDERGIQLFILRLSNAYNEYSDCLSSIITMYSGKSIGYEEVLEALQGTENYAVDDFVYALLNPMGSGKVIKRRKIYRIYGSLIQSMSAERLLNTLLNKIDIFISFRRLINNGDLPVSVAYSATEVQDKLPEDSRLKTYSAYVFKRMARIASMASLEDWLNMRLLLSEAKRQGKIGLEDRCEKALFSMMHRSVLGDERFFNDSGIISTVGDSELYSLNTVFFRV